MRTPDLYQYRLAGNDSWTTCGPVVFEAFEADPLYETRKLYALSDVGAAVWTPTAALIRTMPVADWRAARFPNLNLAEILEGMAKLLRKID